MKMQFSDLRREYQTIKGDVQRNMERVLLSAGFINGPEVHELEEKLARYTGVSHGVGVGSGTGALLCALMAYDIQPGDEVITSPFTFIATAETILFLKAKPVFADISEEDYNIDPELIEAKITDKTKGIIPVSLFGQCADFERINALAKKHGIFVHEDACQSFGAARNGKRSGGLCHSASTSFFPSKPLGCYGDGGMLFTDDSEFADKVRMFCNHGQKERYIHEEVGLNSRLDSLQAAVLLAKFEHFEEMLKLRRERAAYYTAHISSFVTTPEVAPGNTSVFAQYSIRTPRRDELCRYLNEREIPTAVHYPIPLNKQRAVEKICGLQDCAVSAKVASEIMSLPMSPYITQEEQDMVIHCIREFFS